MVFADLNGNGVRDPDELAVSGVAVSDGISAVVLTDTGGAYSLELNADSQFVTISVPGSYDSVGAFYRRISPDESGRAVQADFALRPVQDPKRFRFIVLTDTHIQDTRSCSRADMVADLLENTAAIKPDFVVHCGDISHGGQEETYRRYLQATARSRRPVYNVPGNHDSKPTFDVCGPRNYSFARGGVHFVVMDSNKPRWQWLQSDLAVVPAGRKIVVFNHHGLGQIGLGPMADRKDDVLAVIHGHGHAWADTEIRGIRHYMADYLGYFGGFAMAEVNNGSLTAEHVKLGSALLKDADSRARRWEEIRRHYPPVGSPTNP